MEITTTDFFNNDYINQASYNNIRTIASYIDGQKNTSRKILHTVIDKNITKEEKVLNLASKMSEFCQYLHGDSSGVIVTMARNYTGTNNLPLLTREGNFGTRFSPEASAPRYIYTMKEKHTDKLFIKDDNTILIQQEFEGDKIEPRFFVPTIPLLLVNGSEGISSGFAQKILSRNPIEIKKWFDNRLNNKKSKVDLTPYFNGFTGHLKQGEDKNKWEIFGHFTRKTMTSIHIDELPIGYNLTSYIKVLTDLVDKKIIRSFKDLSDNDRFLFNVNIDSQTLKGWSEEQVYDKLKLIKKVSENYTCIDENNKVRTFESVEEILEAFYVIRLEYYYKRKENGLAVIKKSLRISASKYLFVKAVIDGTVLVNNKKKDEIVAQLDAIENIVPDEGSYDFLLRMPIYSLTEEKVQDLLQEIKKGKEAFGLLNETEETALWLEDLGGL